ncbi:MAG: hypothetical protein AB7T06_06670 [Kofleriaceae bacterium]
MKRSLHDARLLGEALVVIVVTWFALGWSLVGRTIHQADGNVLGDPLVRGAIEAGSDWSDYLYRFGVLGGSKLHEFSGTMPIVQLCAWLGLPTTIAVNIVTVFVQLGFAFFGAKIATASAPQRLPVRIGLVWLCGFAPVLAWRLAWGHENLLIGLLPFVATAAMLWCARARTASTFSLVFTAFVVCNGITGLGAQTVIYGAVFGLPIVVAIVLDGTPRWTREHTRVVVSLLAGVLVALPRLVPMIAHAAGDDATRSLGETVTYSYGDPVIADWIESLPWTHELAQRSSLVALHERNYPIGPLLVFLPLLWHRTRNRWLGWALILSTALAILFALDVHPISTALLSAIEPLNAFRVPARATLPVTTLLPPLLVAGLLAWTVPPSEQARAPSWPWLAVLVGLVALIAHRSVVAVIAEPLVWLACGGLLVAILMGRARREAVLSITVLVGALGVVAFEARFPTHVPVDQIEDGPAELRAAVLAQAPELASPLARVEIADPSPPFAMSSAWAAGLSTLDGVWYPPRRFLVLLNALMDNRYPSTSAVFTLSGTSGFPVLQQMYNVTRLVSLAQGGIIALPETPGAAWFPREVTVIDRPAQFALALSDVNLHDAIRDRAWALRSEVPSIPVRCENARVTGTRVDDRGQSVAIGVELAQPCVLVVATNYVSTMVATVAGVRTRVFPIDIALTGIEVPAGATEVVLDVEVRVPIWTRIAQVLGFLLLAGLAALAARDQKATDVARAG